MVHYKLRLSITAVAIFPVRQASKHRTKIKICLYPEINLQVIGMETIDLGLQGCWSKGSCSSPTCTDNLSLKVNFRWIDIVRQYLIFALFASSTSLINCLQVALFLVMLTWVWTFSLTLDKFQRPFNITLQLGELEFVRVCLIIKHVCKEENK